MSRKVWNTNGPDYDNEERIAKDIEHIKEWLKKQPHLRVRQDERWLRAFLVGSKLNLERTKQRLDVLYTLRQLIPEFYRQRDPLHPDIQLILERGMLLPLYDKEDPTGPTVVLLRAGLWDPSKTKREDVFRTYLMIMDVILVEMVTKRILQNGVTIVVDFRKIRPEHANTPAILRLQARIILSMPERLVSVHCLYKPTLFYAAWEMLKLVVPAEKRDRMSDSNTFEEAFKQVPQRLFPKEYGGQAGTLRELSAETKKLVESYRDWLLEEDKYGCDERLRPGKPKTYQEVFGVEGSFRQLDID